MIALTIASPPTWPQQVSLAAQPHQALAAMLAV
jgi:hypothetical protein